MVKYLYRFLFLLTVFVLSLYLFAGDIKEGSGKKDYQTIAMGDATYPIISLLLGETEINQLHGYSNDIDSRISRDHILPLDDEQSFKVGIKENDYDIKRVDYELYSIYDDKLIESDNIKALEQEGLYKMAKIKFKADLKEDQEYSARITLITNKSKKIHYYTRIKRINDSKYKEKVDYVNYFHSATLNKDDSIVDYLELTDSSLDSLAYVTVNSSYHYVTWGDLNPQIVGDVIPTIKEISKEFASIELKYMVFVEKEESVEYYYVSEFYRIRYSSTRIYLLNYERKMEGLFNKDQINGINNEIKLGITNNTDIELIKNTDQTKLAFVYNRELWYFNQLNHQVVNVFSFIQENSDYVRDIYDQHDVKIINMDEGGNIDFMVYGYMNRGAYEGYVGVLLYRFYSMDDRIEELAYIPLNVPHQVLKEMMKDFTYLNQVETFYFHINDSLYGYNLVTKELQVITSNLDHDNFVFSKAGKYVAWEEKEEDGLAKKLIIYHLEKEEKIEIEEKENKVLKLYGTIGEDFIYGIANVEDIITSIEGEQMIPSYKLVISNQEGKILKEYEKEGYIIRGIQIENNIITVNRGTLSKDNGLLSIQPVEDDNILNKMDLSKDDIKIIEKEIQEDEKEWYIEFPLQAKELEKAYEYKKTRNTIVTEDTTLRIEKEIEYPGKYIVYALGDVKGFYNNAAKAIEEGSNLVGLVLNTKQHLIWERGFTKPSNQIKIDTIEQEINIGDSFTRSAKNLIRYKYGNVSMPNNMTAYELLEEHFNSSLVNFTGAKLDEALYFVSENRPVITKLNSDKYGIIIGYDSYSIYVLDQAGVEPQKLSLERAKELIEEQGSVFISYSEEF